VQVHHVPEVSPFLDHVNEASRELVAELDVVAAAAPLPVLPALRSLPVLVVARARVQGAFRARPGYGMGDGSAGYGVDEGGFS